MGVHTKRGRHPGIQLGTCSTKVENDAGCILGEKHLNHVVRYLHFLVQIVPLKWLQNWHVHFYYEHMMYTYIVFGRGTKKLHVLCSAELRTGRLPCLRSFAPEGDPRCKEV